jgi:hypothetical protein
LLSIPAGRIDILSATEMEVADIEPGRLFTIETFELVNSLILANKALGQESGPSEDSEEQAKSKYQA